VLGNGRQLMDALLSQLALTLPSDALSLLRRTLDEIVTSNGSAGVMSIGVLLAGWSGSQIFGSLEAALNVAYDVTETRSWWRRQLMRLICLIAAGAVVFAATLVFLDGERVAGWLGELFHLGEAAVVTLTIAQLIVAVALLVSLGAVIYKLLPNVKQRWSHAWLASAMATTLWILATLLFRLYVQHFGAYNKTYGTIGGVILLLTWMYYTMFVVLIGGELASELHHGTGAVDPDKGATYLGRIVSEGGPGRASMDAGSKPR